MHIVKVYEQGNVFDAAVLDLRKDVLLQKFQGGIMNLTKMSLGGGVVNKLSATHHILNSFKNLACVSFASNYSFEQAEKMKSAAGSRPAGAGAVATEAKVEEKKEEKEEEEVDVDMGGLFGGDDDEY
jgi:large subunit ribosomal protein LP0